MNISKYTVVNWNFIYVLGHTLDFRGDVDEIFIDDKEDYEWFG